MLLSWLVQCHTKTSTWLTFLLVFITPPKWATLNSLKTWMVLAPHNTAMCIAVSSVMFRRTANCYVAVHVVKGIIITRGSCSPDQLPFHHLSHVIMPRISCCVKKSSSFLYTSILGIVVWQAFKSVASFSSCDLSIALFLCAFASLVLFLRQDICQEQSVPKGWYPKSSNNDDECFKTLNTFSVVNLLRFPRVAAYSTAALGFVLVMCHTGCT